MLDRRKGMQLLREGKGEGVGEGLARKGKRTRVWEGQWLKGRVF